MAEIMIGMGILTGLQFVMILQLSSILKALQELAAPKETP